MSEIVERLRRYAKQMGEDYNLSAYQVPMIQEAASEIERLRTFLGTELELLRADYKHMFKNDELQRQRAVKAEAENERLRAAGNAAFYAMCAYRDSPDKEIFQDAIDALGMALNGLVGSEFNCLDGVHRYHKHDMDKTAGATEQKARDLSRYNVGTPERPIYECLTCHTQDPLGYQRCCNSPEECEHWLKPRAPANECPACGKPLDSSFHKEQCAFWDSG